MSIKQLLIKPSVFATWVNGWVQFTTGLITILSFGFYRPSLDFMYSEWRLRGQVRNSKKWQSRNQKFPLLAAEISKSKA